MFRDPEILVSARARRFAPLLAAAALLGGCGQKGPLYLPTGAEAAGRATLVETLTPAPRVAPSTTVAPSAIGPASAPPATGRAAPVRNP